MNCKGFTLIELLIVGAIGSIILAAIFGIIAIFFLGGKAVNSIPADYRSAARSEFIARFPDATNIQVSCDPNGICTVSGKSAAAGENTVKYACQDKGLGQAACVEG